MKELKPIDGILSCSVAGITLCATIIIYLILGMVLPFLPSIQTIAPIFAIEFPCVFFIILIQNARKVAHK
jgi:hypothetical protein